MRVADIKRRLTGFSTPFGGISWQPEESEEQSARRVIAYLEDRRILYDPFEVEVPEYGAESVLDIRRFVTSEIGALGAQSPLADNLRAIRAACRKFLNAIDSDDRPHAGARYWGHSRWSFDRALGELRNAIGVHVALIASRYEFDVEDDLARILPVEDVD